MHTEEATVKRYVTKYAVSRGVFLTKGLMLPGGHFRYVGYGWATANEHFATWDEALADAERRRVRHIEEAEKQLEKLRNMTFAEPTEVLE